MSCIMTQFQAKFELTLVLGMGRCKGLRRKVEDYTSTSSLHGVQHLTTGPLPLRLLWFLLLLLALLGASIFAKTILVEWQEHRTATSLRTMTKPVEELTFPAVTICRGGQDLQAVRAALQEDIAAWQEREEQEGRRKRAVAAPHSDDYCMERFGVACSRVEEMTRVMGSPVGGMAEGGGLDQSIASRGAAHFATTCQHDPTAQGVFFFTISLIFTTTRLSGHGLRSAGKK